MEQTIRWHKFSERKPSKNGVYLIKYADGEIRTAYWNGMYQMFETGGNGLNNPEWWAEV